MVECRRSPGAFVVAGQASLREIILRVTGIGCGVVITLMAAIALSGKIFELVVDMAINTSGQTVGAV